MNSTRACALLLLANKLYRPLFSDMLILITGEGAVIPSVEVYVAVRICCTIVVGGPPTTSVIGVEYMSISLSPVSEIDVMVRVYWVCASMIRSISPFGGVSGVAL